jgi:hypothetical protein
MLRVTMFDDATRATMPSHARTWARRAHSTEPVDWTRWETGVSRCYQYAGLRMPPVVRVPSPLALARALFLGHVTEIPGDEDRAVIGLIERIMRTRVDRTMSKSFSRFPLAQARTGVFEPVDAVTGTGAIAAAVEETLREHDAAGDPRGTRDAAEKAAERIRELALRPSGRTPRRDRATWRSWALHFPGQFDAAWTGYASFLAEATGAPGGRGWPRRLQAFTAAQSAGWWWPGLDFVVVSERPTVVRTEPAGDLPGRLHCADGPAVVWRDGWRLYFWHGTRVPEWVVTNPTMAAVAAEPNVEVRRCAIEAMGWDTYITGAGLRLLDTAGDPGNDGCVLRLYDLPHELWGTPGRVLLVTNGSAERDGTRRRYGLPVPADTADAVAAAAWTYGLTGEQYTRLARRT